MFKPGDDDRMGGRDLAAQSARVIERAPSDFKEGECSSKTRS